MYDSQYYCHLYWSFGIWYEHLNLFDYNLYGDPAMNWRGVDVAAADDVSSRGLDFLQLYNHPNPCTSGTTIHYTLPSDGPVQLEVFNLLGQRVATLTDGAQPAGTHRAQWDARTADGSLAPGGIYFYRIQANGQVATRRMTLVR